MMDTITKNQWKKQSIKMCMVILVLLCCNTTATTQSTSHFLASVETKMSTATSIPPVERKKKKKKTRRARKKKRKGQHQATLHYADWDRSYMMGIGFLGILFAIPVVTLGVFLILNYILTINIWVVITSMTFIFGLGVALLLFGAIALYFLIRGFGKMSQVFPSKQKFDGMLLLGVLSSILATAILIVIPIVLFSAIAANLFAAVLFGALGLLVVAILGIHFSQKSMKNRTEKGKS